MLVEERVGKLRKGTYGDVYLAEHVHPLPSINKRHILRRRHDHRPYSPLLSPLQTGEDERRTINNHQLP